MPLGVRTLSFAGEGGPGDDQLPRHDAVVHDLAPVVDVVDEAVQRPDALGEAALDLRPLGGRDHPRDEIQRERPVAHRSGFGPAHPAGVEGDALLHEDGVAPAAGIDQVLAAERRQRAGQRLRVWARLSRRGVDLVVGERHRS
jgi:hypothetical protein